MGEKELEGAICGHTQEGTLGRVGMVGPKGRVELVLIPVLGLVLGSRAVDEMVLWGKRVSRDRPSRGRHVG